MADLTYSIGTVSVAADDTAVTGTGTLWESVNARQWDWISIDGGPLVPITDIADATHLTIALPSAEEKTDVAYVIYQVSPLRFAGGQAMADVSELIARLRAKGLMWYLNPAFDTPDDARPPLIADEGQPIMAPASGKVWVMQSGSWTYLGVYKPVAVKGTWDADTDYIPGDVVSRGGRLWFCIQAGKGHVPESSPDFWTLFLSGGDRYDLASFDTDRPATGELLVKIYPLGVTFPANLEDSQAGAEVAASADAVFSITKNGVEFGTLTFPAASAEGVFACATDTTFEAGDVLRVIAPTPRDATLSGVAATLVGFR